MTRPRDRRRARAAVAAVLAAALAAGCGRSAVRPPAAPAPRPSPSAPTTTAAPPAPAFREVVTRAELLATLDAGPGAFLRKVRVRAVRGDEGFVGWELVELAIRDPRVARADVRPGDVLLGVNGRRLQRPEELTALWDALRLADAIVLELQRDGARRVLRFPIVD